MIKNPTVQVSCFDLLLKFLLMRWKTLVQLLFLSIFGFWGLWGPAQHSLETCPDSADYIGFNFSSLKTIFTDSRTFAYPLFLKFIGIISPDLSVLPIIQAIISGIAAFIFWLGLRCYGFNGWNALAATVPIFFSPLCKSYIPFVMTESLAGSLAIATVGVLMISLRYPKSICLWVILAIVMFFTYQVRPAYLYLILFIPLLGFLLLLGRLKWCGFKEVGRIVVTLLIICILPFLAFGLLRWIYVGSFGLVSFGGITASALSVGMLDENTIQKLPVDVQPFALTVLHERNRWIGDAPITRESINEGMGIPFGAAHIWRIAKPLAHKFKDDDVIKQNNRLGRLSKAVYLIRFDLYLPWIIKGWVNGVKEALLGVSHLFILGGILSCFLCISILVFRMRFLAEKTCISISNQVASEISSMAFITFGILFSQTLLTILVNVVDKRYVHLNAVFLPSFICLVLCAKFREMYFLVFSCFSSCTSFLQEDAFQGRKSVNANLIRLRKVGFYLFSLLSIIVILISMRFFRFHLKNNAQKAIVRGDLFTLRKILDNHPSVEFMPGIHGVSLLHVAALTDHLDILEFLLSRVKQADNEDEDGLTPLHWAAVAGKSENVELLLHLESDVNHSSHNGIVSLHLAANTKTAEVLLKNGANPDAIDNDGGTPLHWAVNPDVVDVLLKAGANPNVKENLYTDDDEGYLGQTPLHRAIFRGDWMSVQRLIAQSTTDINCQDLIGMTPLCWMQYCWGSQPSNSVELLLNRGADPCISFSFLAPMYKKHAMNRCIEDICINLPSKNLWTWVNRDDDMTAIHLAALLNQERLIKVFLDRHYNVNQLSKRGMTPLHYAVISNSSEMVELLLKRGANLVAKNQMGFTPLQIALQLGRQEIVRILLEFRP